MSIFKPFDNPFWTIKPHVTTIDIAQSKPKFKTNRGITRFKTQILKQVTLTCISCDDTSATFQNGTLKLTLTVTHSNPYRFAIDAPRNYNQLTLRVPSSKNEAFFGTGSQFSRVNLKGSTVPIWVSEHHSLNKLLKKRLRNVFMRERKALEWIEPDYAHHSYHAQPTFISSKMFGFHADINAYSHFAFHDNETVLTFHAIPKSITLSLGKTFKTVVSDLSKTIGHPKPLPKWTASGAILAVQGGIEKAHKKYETARASQARIAALWAQDWCGQTITMFGDQVTWDWTLDTTRYAAIKKDTKNVRWLGYMNPYLKKDAPLYQEAFHNDYLVKRQNGKPYHVLSTTFKAGIIDLTNPKARNWIIDIIGKELIENHFSGWMVDFGEYLPVDSVLHSGNPLTMHNRWPSLWAEVNREAIERCGKVEKPFIFVRSAYTGTQKHINTMWTGDQHVDFSHNDGLYSALKAHLASACSGILFNHSDIGGYTTLFHMKRTPELFKRWSEMNLFTPLFRTHEGNFPRRNTQFDDPCVIEHFSWATSLFAELAPYNIHTRERALKTGVPFNRPLFIDFGNDYNHIYDQFMAGDDIIVAPIINANQYTREVIIPSEGEWIKLFDNTHFVSGIHTVTVPLGKPAVFYKKTSPFASLFAKLKALTN